MSEKQADFEVNRLSCFYDACFSKAIASPLVLIWLILSSFVDTLKIWFNTIWTSRVCALKVWHYFTASECDQRLGMSTASAFACDSCSINLSIYRRRPPGQIAQLAPSYCDDVSRREGSEKAMISLSGISLTHANLDWKITGNWHWIIYSKNVAVMVNLTPGRCTLKKNPSPFRHAPSPHTLTNTYTTVQTRTRTWAPTCKETNTNAQAHTLAQVNCRCCLLHDASKIFCAGR